MENLLVKISVGVYMRVNLNWKMQVCESGQRHACCYTFYHHV